MELWGGERIFRRAFTKQLIRLVKQADSVKNDEEQYNRICKRIGKKMFKEIKAQDNRPAEYVQSPT
jgi:translation elongation factor EF-1alpha